MTTSGERASSPSARNHDARRCLAVVLAAGEGTRMRSRRPKVLHEVAGRSMLGHVLATTTAAGAGEIAVVVGPDRDDVAAAAKKAIPAAEIHEQRERLGTAHAVLAARAAIARGAEDVIIAFGDTPLVTAETFRRLREALADGAAVAVLGFEAADPTGYGRLVRDGDALLAIREHKDASASERAITLCNGGVMALAGSTAIALLEAVGNSNAKGEYYLTDVVEIAHRRGLATRALTVSEDEIQGVNDRAQLAQAEASFQKRLRGAALAMGVTLVAPDTVFLSADTAFGTDVVVEPNVIFGPGVTIGDGAVIHAFSHIEGATVGAGASVGPFARLRPGADLGEGARVGNFVEIKAATLGAGAKVNHLTYIGDASVGAATNIGAGTITCNYDGFRKHRTTIGANAFIGSNSSLVAPVTIGDGAFVGSGSVITADVPADALALGRGRQAVKEGWVPLFRDKFGPKGDH
ncbi:bifunctional UDP-N-acetylglucosamine diphosphorylase/glucosamine-1-phosphate N-acetyltransferase GlmU [Chelatococcus asaccharovorans]|uniref:bifunctional UDP-N-acetylglucosamine diphosphorylase/glucosamine-1-phosphate N-acetyltransferase GlmU n=1 Tax=Chelatococcus asaccharovorans TaxID=28210 RepID=UPI00224C7AC9|nr:bifunctional UDP-N-acetylglucosamine diphosphorylase/glucosamine-1-phosphate N-acetyltransferase GlmU [Chelatococcus asaccharovorans]CAH1674024.1 fused N-acetylglucosamine-1-phosphate uridyltransferase and glucosamine-1-phosphate acetyltransferase [Chelatococcus asaccharovorans]CAH1674598.1 fused N-acetylglucosamine-1-phosphate uridyltransferase and glucosamine-1-phosphate acetyltransferase [Chelatococcus asaccharovorans]